MTCKTSFAARGNATMIRFVEKAGEARKLMAREAAERVSVSQTLLDW